jgi:hypothetical protein
LPGAAAVAAKGKAGFAAAASAVKRGLQVQAAFGGGKGKAGARVGSDGGGATRSSGDGAAAPSLAAQLEVSLQQNAVFPFNVGFVCCVNWIFWLLYSSRRLCPSLVGDGRVLLVCTRSP